MKIHAILCFVIFKKPKAKVKGSTTTRTDRTYDFRTERMPMVEFWYSHNQIFRVEVSEKITFLGRIFHITLLNYGYSFWLSQAAWHRSIHVDASFPIKAVNTISASIAVDPFFSCSIKKEIAQYPLSRV